MDFMVLTVSNRRPILNTSVFTRNGLKRNCSLLYTIQLIQKVLDAYHQSQLREFEIATAK